MLLISGIVFFFLGLYLDYVLPKKFGERKKACFCLPACCRKGNKAPRENFLPASKAAEERRATIKSSSGKENVVDPFEVVYLSKKNYEPVPPEVARLELEADHPYL